ncbi:hypothetical protein FGAF829_33800 [Escherichia coli]|nr:hypothetical protein FGAF829_33800 [Escherichia coli]
MAKNDFKAFATDRNANVISQEEWEALPALLSGFTAGKASSAQVNKVIRQASFIAAALAQFVSDKTQRDVLDNGDLPGFVELLGSGFAVEYLSRKNPFGDIKSDGTVKTALENLGIGEIYAPINSPSFTGTPCVPTADQSEIDFRIANTAFVAQAIAILNGGAPAALNTLKKLALAINNDASFYSTVNNALGQKAALSDFTYSKTSSSVVGNQPGGLRFMCGETSVPTDSNGNVFITLPDTFLNRVVYAEAHQSKGSYTADVEPFIFSSYPTSNGPTSTISFAVRNSKTGVPLINSAITLQYFVKGY